MCFVGHHLQNIWHLEDIKYVCIHILDVRVLFTFDVDIFVIPVGVN
jgi:hypothetical protein